MADADSLNSLILVFLKNYWNLKNFYGRCDSLNSQILEFNKVKL